MKLFFEALIKESAQPPEDRIRIFFDGKSPEKYIHAYKKAIEGGVDVIAGDYEDAQPKYYPIYRDYVNARMSINLRIAQEIKRSTVRTVSFYGSEHCVLRDADPGIPNFLVKDSFLVFQPLLYSSQYDIINTPAPIVKLLKEATKDKTNQIIIVKSKLDIDWPDYFIIIPDSIISETNQIIPIAPDEPTQIGEIPGNVSLRKLAYNYATNPELFLQLMSISTFVPADLSEWLKITCEGKHVLIKDRHGQAEHPAFLEYVIEALRDNNGAKVKKTKNKKIKNKKQKTKNKKQKTKNKKQKIKNKTKLI